MVCFRMKCVKFIHVFFKMTKIIIWLKIILLNDNIDTWGNQRAGRLTLFLGGKCRRTLQTKERRVMSMYITYSDLIQIGIFICTLVGLCYTIFKGKRK